MTGRIRLGALLILLAQLLFHACGQKAARSDQNQTASPRTTAKIDADFFRNVSVTLNEEDEPLFAGPGREAINRNCLSCHSADMILNQPTLSKQAWADEVAKMQKIYKAPIPDGDVPHIIAYLTSIKPAA